MNEKLTRATAALLMFVYCAGIVPAHEIASGLAAGKVRIDYYLNRAEKAYDENEWKRLAEEGVLASRAAWERATLALKEQNADEWNALRSEAKLYYENTVAKRYADMIRDRYTRSHEAKISSELTRRLKEKINNFDLSGYTLAETAKLYDDWNEESRKIIDEYLDGYGTENFSEAVRREAEMLSMIEGRRFISRFMKDEHSLKAENDQKTDIYSLCALLYFMLNKHRPMDSLKRFYYPELIYEDYVSKKIRKIIDKGMSMERKERYENIEELEKVIKVVKIPVIAEGNIDTPLKAKKALEIGAFAVVVGGAITRPQQITKKFVDEMK